ncbi:MAG: hypothetical protein WB439_07325 [Acidobacteriaceae bacterium]
MQNLRPALVPLLLVLAFPLTSAAKSPKIHTVTLGPGRKVPYTPPQATADTKSDDSSTLRIRALVVDGVQKEWTLGEVHDVTDRTFVVRRALRINDSLPSEPVRWAWQPGPWLMVDRTTGHVTALHLPDFDPLVSNVLWFRDDAAYCGIATTARGGVIAVIAQLGARKPIVHKLLAPWPQPTPSNPVCAPAIWQRTPMRATLQLTGGQPVTYDVVGSVSLIEDNDNSSPDQ